MTSPAEPQPRRAVKAIRALASPLVWVLALFGGAGRLNWTRGWICVALYVAGMTAIGLAVRHGNAGLMEARAKWSRENTRPFDRIFLAIFIPLTFIQPALAGLDAERFHWSSMALELVYPGAVLFATAILLIAWPMTVNPFAETSVRIQSDRGHAVVQSGPYRFVRHPMYVGAMLMYAATPLVLGSYWALALAALMAALFIWRTALEDRLLRRELAGYEEYAARTRYRLLPGLW